MEEIGGVEVRVFLNRLITVIIKITFRSIDASFKCYKTKIIFVQVSSSIRNSRATGLSVDCCVLASLNKVNLFYSFFEVVRRDIFAGLSK